MQILIAVLGLSILILVHEIGHFTAAKLLKVKVLEFAVFMGPKLLSVKRGETVYSLRAVPIGGFIKMEGEEEDSDDERAFGKKPKWVRATVFFAGPLANMLVAFIFMLIVSMNIQSGTCELSAVAPGSPAAAAGLQAGDVILKYGGKTVKTPTDFEVYLIDSRGAEKSVTFQRDGQLHEGMLKPEYIARGYYLLGFNSMETYGPNWNVAESVSEGGPASAAGMEAGDRVISVDGVPINSREELRGALALKGGGESAVVVQRGGESLELKITPQKSNSEERFIIGAGYVFVNSTGLLDGAKHAINNAVSDSRMILYTLKWLVTGRVGIDQMMGFVGIVTVIGDVVEVSGGVGTTMIFTLMSFLALISVNLALFNLIPFPALDGNKLLLILIEAIRGKKIPPEKEATISFVGLALLILLMAVTLFNDIGRLIAR